MIDVFEMSGAWGHQWLPFWLLDKATNFFWFCSWNCFLFYTIDQGFHRILTRSRLWPFLVFNHNRICESCPRLLQPESSPWKDSRPILMRMSGHHLPFILIHIKINKTTFHIFHLDNILNSFIGLNVHIIFAYIIFHSKFGLN